MSSPPRERYGLRARSSSNRRCCSGHMLCSPTCRRELQKFVAPIAGDPLARIILTGAGTSAYIGGCLAPVLDARLAARVDAVPTTDIVSSPHLHLHADQPLLLVSFGRSGNSPESLQAVTLAESLVKDVRHLLRDLQCRGRVESHAGTPGHDAAAARGNPRREFRDDLELQLHDVRDAECASASRAPRPSHRRHRAGHAARDPGNQATRCGTGAARPINAWCTWAAVPSRAWRARPRSSWANSPMAPWPPASIRRWASGTAPRPSSTIARWSWSSCPTTR